MKVFPAAANCVCGFFPAQRFIAFVCRIPVLRAWYYFSISSAFG